MISPQSDRKVRINAVSPRLKGRKMRGGLISLIYRPRKDGKPILCENKFCSKRLQGQYKILGRQNGVEFHICLRCYFLMIAKSKGKLEQYVPKEYKTRMTDKQLQKELS